VFRSWALCDGKNWLRRKNAAAAKITIKTSARMIKTSPLLLPPAAMQSSYQLADLLIQDLNKLYSKKKYQYVK